MRAFMLAGIPLFGGEERYDSEYLCLKLTWKVGSVSTPIWQLVGEVGAFMKPG